MFYLTLFIIDRITKALLLNQSPVDTQFLKLSFTPNYSYFNLPIPEGLVLTLTILGVFFIYSWAKHSKAPLNLALNLILVGGLSNLLDRLVFGYVIDWIYITPFPFTFNLADLFITLGVVIAILNHQKAS